MTSTSRTRRAVLAALAAVPAASLPARAAALPDPILTAIEAHRHALAAYEAAVDISSRLMDDAPAHAAAIAVTRRAGAALAAAGIALIEVAPTTLAGLAALLEHLVECSRRPGRRLAAARALVDTGGDGEHAFAYLALRAAAETLARLTAA